MLLRPIVLAFLALLQVAALAAHAGDTPRRLAEPRLPQPPFSYRVDLPPHLSALSETDSTPAASPVTDAGATLGRVLFHDRNLSKNGLVACASCHTQALGFDDRTRFSIGFKGLITRRAAMSLANARYTPDGRYFRDQRATTLEHQVLEPFTDPIEMGLEPGELSWTIGKRPFYRPLFTAAFGDAQVTDERIGLALSQYVRSIVSLGAPYDVARAKAQSPLDEFTGFSPAQNRGKHLFFTARQDGGAGCASCHATEAFVMLEPKNNGLDITGTDGGLGEITGLPQDIGRFRAATLKNIAVTMPYMHDGRFRTLESVIDHYSSGVKPHPNLSPELRDEHGKPARLNLSQADKAALAAFLETLTDASLLADPRFADPFAGR
jgi:cytochrome c peroxidase